MIGTGTIVLIVFLFLILAIAIWYFVVAYNYGSSLTVASYTRGANLDTATINAQGQPTSTGKGTVNFTCDPDREICVYRATAICTGAENALSNNESGVEPISNGLTNNGYYGNFDTNNTFDLTDSLSTLANGLQTYSYSFDASSDSKIRFNGQVCPYSNYGKSGAGPQFVRPQLIATYSCIPKGSQCLSANSTIPYTPIVPVSPHITYGSQITLKNQSTKPGYNTFMRPCGTNSTTGCNGYYVTLAPNSAIKNINNWTILGKTPGTLLNYGDVIQLKCQNIPGNFNASYLSQCGVPFSGCGILPVSTMMTYNDSANWTIIGGQIGQPVRNGDVIQISVTQYGTDIIFACSSQPTSCGISLGVGSPTLPNTAKWQIMSA